MPSDRVRSARVGAVVRRDTGRVFEEAREAGLDVVNVGDAVSVRNLYWAVKEGSDFGLAVEAEGDRITEAGTTWSAQMAARPIREWQKTSARLQKLDEMARRLIQLERELGKSKNNE